MRLIVYVSALCIGLTPVFGLAQSARPFWTEKSTYTESTKTYFVGVATAKKSVEAAREVALKNARTELMNHLQITDVKDIKFHTQMTFEEKTSAGETTVYRLMYVEAEDIEKLRERSTQALIKAQEQAEKANEERIRKTEAAIQKARASEEKLQSKQSELDEIVAKIDTATSNAEEKLKCGMIKAEVLKVMGQPRSKDSCADKVHFNYGRIWASFDGGVLKCLMPVGDFSACRSCPTYGNELCK